MTITFIDSVMGSGKSTYAINYINQHKDTRKIIVASPILDEVTRYATACGIQQPSEFPSKAINLHRLLQQGQSVSISHALLLGMDAKMLQEIKSQGYELVLDEVIADAIHVHPTYRDTLETMTDAGLVSVDPTTKRLTWLKSASYQDHMDIRDACLEGEVSAVSNQFVVSHLNMTIFAAFSQVQILTYMAPYSMLAKLFEVKGVLYNVWTLDGHGKPAKLPLIYSGRQFAGLLHIDNTPRRQLDFKLSVSGQNKLTPRKRILLSKYTNGFFAQYGRGIPKSDRIWTTYLAHAKSLLTGGSRQEFDLNNFIQHSSKATNNYSYAALAAYLVDKYPHPAVVQYLTMHGVSFYKSTSKTIGEQDLWALSEMIQWIWRTRIRNGQPIHLYVPSARMKKLLEDWLR